ncbi:MAG: hypothetical protein IPJ34_13085 [Myxococcales bacterium]|nr:hypothetical protein [Myxococcales bacterium]
MLQAATYRQDHPRARGLLDALPGGEIVVLQPRRLAARHSAKRVAEERSVRLGRLVGYDVASTAQ